MKKRIIISGLGIISPLGNNTKNVWNNIMKGISGINFIKDFDTSEFQVKIAGTVKDFLISNFNSQKIFKKLDVFTQYGISAGIQAIEDSELNSNPKIKKNEIGIIMGSGIGGLTSIEKNHEILMKNGPKKIKPMFIPSCIINNISGFLSIIYKFTGPNLAVTTACSSSGYAIYLGAQFIKENKTKIMIVGGAEKASTPLGVSGFSALKALSRNKNPKKASRPWDIDRDGFVIGDGAGCLVLEEYKHAVNRNAKIYAELISSNVNSDAFNIMSPDPNGNGIFKCMKTAVKKAKIKPENIDYINAHATSTKKGDITESIAIKKLLGKNYKKTMIGSTKSLTGHLLGAAGSVEAIITILSLTHQTVPANINLEKNDPRCNYLNFIKKNKKKNIKYAMSNSFGFGGTNSTIIMKKIQ